MGVGDYVHDGGSNRACDGDGRLIGWLVYTGPDRTSLRVVDRDGQKLIIERIDSGYTVRTESGELRAPRRVSRDDRFYLELADDGSVRVLVDGEGRLCVSPQDFERAKGNRS